MSQIAAGATVTKPIRPSLRVRVQRMGGFLSSMVMPNIGVFIAWGLITAFVIPTGWTPNANLARLVGPTITYLLPLLIAYTGGAKVYGKRGGAIGALATMGVIVGANVTMLLGGMVMGPLAALILKHVDRLYEGRVKAGLEMLVDNFVLGIVGGLLMLLGFLVIEPIFNAILTVLSAGVNWLLARHLIPLLSLIVPPGQVLFLNNAINHGIMVPLGIQQTRTMGKSILFLVEANGGNWCGLLAAFCVFGKGTAKRTAPASLLIQCIGGIGEVAFPYVLIKPILILSPILGSMAGLLTLTILHGGTVGPVSPGSILALIAMTPKGSFIANLSGYIVAAIVAFLVAAVILKADKTPESEYVDGDVLAQQTTATATTPETGATAGSTTVAAGGIHPIHRLALICDAGMGSSVMGASILKSKITKAGLPVEVVHAPIGEIPDGLDAIVTNKILEQRVRDRIGAVDTPVWTIDNFLSQPEYDAIVDRVRQANSAH